jgi:hypothetical protein
VTLFQDVLLQRFKNEDWGRYWNSKDNLEGVLSESQFLQSVLVDIFNRESENDSEDNVVLLPKICKHNMDEDNRTLEEEIMKQLQNDPWSHDVHISNWNFVKEVLFDRVNAIGRFNEGSYSPELAFAPNSSRVIFFECRALDKEDYGWNDLQSSIDQCYEALTYSNWRSCSLVVLGLCFHPELEFSSIPSNYIPSGYFYYDPEQKSLDDFNGNIHICHTIVVWDNIEVFLVNEIKLQEIFGSEFPALEQLVNKKLLLDKQLKIMKKADKNRDKFSTFSPETALLSYRNQSQPITVQHQPITVQHQPIIPQQKAFIVQVEGRRRPMYVLMPKDRPHGIAVLRESIRKKFQIDEEVVFLIVEQKTGCEISDDESVQFLEHMTKLDVEMEDNSMRTTEPQAESDPN